MIVQIRLVEIQILPLQTGAIKKNAKQPKLLGI
jgi:hypothetical protein